MKNNIYGLIFVFLGVVLAGCSHDFRNDPDMERLVEIKFNTRSLPGSLSKSAANVEENSITKIILFGVNNQGEVIQTFPHLANPQLSGTTLTVLRAVKWFYVIANPSAALETATPATVSDLMALTCDFADAPISPFPMSGKSEVSGAGINIELIRAVAKIEVIGKNDFQIDSISVTNAPAKGYVFKHEPLSIPASGKISYSANSNTSVYVPESDNADPLKIVVFGQFENKQASYTIILKNNGLPVDVVRNTNYQVAVTPITKDECDIEITIPEWDDVIIDYTVPNFGKYYVVDFHQHTGYSDGSQPIDFVLDLGSRFGIDVMVNSDHGGRWWGNAALYNVNNYNNLLGTTYNGDIYTWEQSGLTPTDFKGDAAYVTDYQDPPQLQRAMWAWQRIKEYSFPKIHTFNQSNSGVLAIQGLEWNVTGAEHAAMGIITEQFDATNANADALAEFEFKFDNADIDWTGGTQFGWTKVIGGWDWNKALEGAQWLQTNHKYKSWVFAAHPERRNLWNITKFREMNDIAPDVFVGFEAAPGHQAGGPPGTTPRGEYNASSYGGFLTFGSYGYFASKVGGVWDAMISEGRHFWIVTNSDFHQSVHRWWVDFYPGEYHKTYLSMKSKTAQGFVDGLRAGNIYCVHGDLIDRLEFSVGTAVMGETFETSGSTVKIRILVRDPETSNHNIWSAYNNPVLDHIDLIAGDMRPKVASGTPEYSVDTYANVGVIARFDATGGVTCAGGITSIKWKDLGGGIKLIEHTVPITGDTYFRLRGTNNGLNVPGQTDGYGNPLEDLPQPVSNSMQAAVIAFENLWFYSNPIFVRNN